MENRFNTFTTMISNISRNIYKLKSAEMKEVGLKSTHVSCIYYLYKFTSLTAKELCDICQENKAAISRAVDFLEQNGYVTCNSQLSKRYRSPLELTEKGRKVGKIVDDKINNLLDCASKGLSIKERDSMYKSLSVINENLNTLAQNKGEI